MSNELMFEEKQISGLETAIYGMRNPTKTHHLSDSNNGVIGAKDLAIGKALINKGTSHGKFTRGIHVWFEINMPRYIWSELDTYVVGVDPISSESTMYTLVKECKNVSTDMFSKNTSIETVIYFRRFVEMLEQLYGSRKNIPIDVLKAGLPEGWMQKRHKVFGYQALRGLYHDRKEHRLPEWQFICSEIEKLPYFEELICG